MTVAEEKKTETVDTAPKAAKEEKKKDAKSSKPGLGAKIKKFFKDYKSEMKEGRLVRKAPDAEKHRPCHRVPCRRQRSDKPA
ncbi:MAG: hypothetical protein BHW37_05000 [Firmicutes bacterium CAG:272_52_7]|nr:MAG: hypothetical protein BHW37_05000 [Firmicutes bacterium CAG:272_52_7]